MHSGLIAPQFGLGRISKSGLDDEPPAPAPRQAAAPAAAAPGGPTVILKRRRHVQGAAASAPLEPGQAPMQARPQKVFRLDAQRLVPAAENPPPVPPEPEFKAEAAAPVASEAVPAAKARRRKDPVQQPTLVRHVVFEPPPPAPAGSPASALPDTTPESEPQPQPHAGVGRTQVLAAMDRLRTTLDGLVRARDAFADLDEHLIGLGVPNTRP